MNVNPTAPTRAELARELLRYKMMEYSEDFRCATWLVDLEFELWKAGDTSDPQNSEAYETSLSRELRILGEVAEGWWVYEDETRPSETGPVFISMDRWHELLAE